MTLKQLYNSGLIQDDAYIMITLDTSSKRSGFIVLADCQMGYLYLEGDAVYDYTSHQYPDMAPFYIEDLDNIDGISLHESNSFNNPSIVISIPYTSHFKNW